MQPWAAKEKVSRNLTERGYDDPTAHCFPQGVPRSMYVPQGIQIVQTPDYIVMLYERTSWRIVPCGLGANIFPIRCGCGRAIRSGTGKATRW